MGQNRWQRRARIEAHRVRVHALSVPCPACEAEALVACVPHDADMLTRRTGWHFVRLCYANSAEERRTRSVREVVADERMRLDR